MASVQTKMAASPETMEAHPIGVAVSKKLSNPSSTSTIKSDPVADIVSQSKTPHACQCGKLKLHQSGKATVPLTDLEKIAQAKGSERQKLKSSAMD